MVMVLYWETSSSRSRIDCSCHGIKACLCSLFLFVLKLNFKQSQDDTSSIWLLSKLTSTCPNLMVEKQLQDSPNQQAPIHSKLVKPYPPSSELIIFVTVSPFVWSFYVLLQCWSMLCNLSELLCKCSDYPCKCYPIPALMFYVMLQLKREITYVRLMLNATCLCERVNINF